MAGVVHKFPPDDVTFISHVTLLTGRDCRGLGLAVAPRDVIGGEPWRGSGFRHELASIFRSPPTGRAFLKLMDDPLSVLRWVMRLWDN